MKNENFVGRNFWYQKMFISRLILSTAPRNCKFIIQHNSSNIFRSILVMVCDILLDFLYFLKNILTHPGRYWFFQLFFMILLLTWYFMRFGKCFVWKKKEKTDWRQSEILNLKTSNDVIYGQLLQWLPKLCVLELKILYENSV